MSQAFNVERELLSVKFLAYHLVEILIGFSSLFQGKTDELVDLWQNIFEGHLFQIHAVGVEHI